MKVGDYVIHSALGTRPDAPALDRFQGRNGLALTWDLAAEGLLPEAFDQCDVLYAEPPAPAGWRVFHERAGIEPAMTYRAFIGLCSRLVQDRGGVLVVCTQAEKYALAARFTERVELHRPDWSQLAKWYCDPPKRSSLTVDGVLTTLAGRYDCIGDFCCGCGHTGAAFVAAGKRYVMSDVEPRCTGYISKQEWA